MTPDVVGRSHLGGSHVFLSRSMFSMKNTPPSGRVSSPASTGGAGALFEQHVGAHWLALLLVRGIPPVLRDCTISEVTFQAERFGWNTDDFLIVGDTGTGIKPKL